MVEKLSQSTTNQNIPQGAINNNFNNIKDIGIWSSYPFQVLESADKAIKRAGNAIKYNSHYVMERAANVVREVPSILKGLGDTAEMYTEINNPAGQEIPDTFRVLETTDDSIRRASDVIKNSAHYVMEKTNNTIREVPLILKDLGDAAEIYAEVNNPAGREIPKELYSDLHPAGDPVGKVVSLTFDKTNKALQSGYKSIKKKFVVQLRNALSQNISVFRESLLLSKLQVQKELNNNFNYKQEMPTNTQHFSQNSNSSSGFFKKSWEKFSSICSSVFNKIANIPKTPKSIYSSLCKKINDNIQYCKNRIKIYFYNVLISIFDNIIINSGQ